MPKSWEEAEAFFWEQYASLKVIWEQGGWAMYALALIAFVMFLVGMIVLVRLIDAGFARVPERTWRRWIDHPEERRGTIGRLLDYLIAPTRELTEQRFLELRTNRLRSYERDLKVMTICVSAAPLVGLLGTVTGMLTTFSGLGAGNGGDQAMAAIAKGISEALVTTKTGLVVALPGLFFQFFLSRGFDYYKGFLQKLEVVSCQSLYGKKPMSSSAVLPH